MLNTFKSVLKWVIAIVIICVVAYFLASINGLSVSRTIATVGENEITEAEYKYYLETVKSQMLSEAGAEDAKEFWASEIDGKKATDVAKERALDEVIRTEISVIKAEEAGVTLSDAELKEANIFLTAKDADTKAQLKEIKKVTGADKFQIADMMEKLYLSNAYYRFVAAQENSPVAADDVAAKEYADKEYAAVKHVLIMNTPESEEADAEAYAKDAKKKAEDLLNQAVSGANFEKLIEEYGEDPGMAENPDGYILDKNGVSVDGSGQMVKEFTEGSFKVNPGEVNPELVESSYGWHIIKRYALPTSGDNATMIQSASKNAVMSDKFDAYIDGLKESLGVSVKENILKGIKVK